MYYASLFLCYRTCYWNLRTLKPMRRYAVHCRYISMYYFQDSFGTCVYVYTCMHHRVHVCIIGCLPQSFLKSPPTCTCTVCAHVIPHSRKLSREKTFANFAVLWLFVKVFFTIFGGVASFGVVKASNPWNRQFAKVFSLESFPLYSTFPSYVTLSICLCTVYI